MTHTGIYYEETKKMIDDSFDFGSGLGCMIPATIAILVSALTFRTIISLL